MVASYFRGASTRTWSHLGPLNWENTQDRLCRCTVHLACDQLHSMVSTIIDPSITKTDYLAACIDVQFQGQLRSSSSRRAHNRLVFADTKAIDLTLLQGSDVIAPQLDVHSHAAQLQRTIVDAIAPQCKRLPPRPRKQSISAGLGSLFF